MLQTRINFSRQKNATMLTVRFFSNKTNTILERNLIVDQEDDRQSVLDYLAQSLGKSTSCNTLRKTFCVSLIVQG